MIFLAEVKDDPTAALGRFLASLRPRGPGEAAGEDPQAAAGGGPAAAQGALAGPEGVGGASSAHTGALHNEVRFVAFTTFVFKKKKTWGIF